jgi:hypothetical protein
MTAKQEERTEENNALSQKLTFVLHKLRMNRQQKLLISSPDVHRVCALFTYGMTEK